MKTQTYQNYLEELKEKIQKLKEIDKKIKELEKEKKELMHSYFEYILSRDFQEYLEEKGIKEKRLVKINFLHIESNSGEKFTEEELRIEGVIQIEEEELPFIIEFSRNCSYEENDDKIYDDCSSEDDDFYFFMTDNPSLAEKCLELIELYYNPEF